MNATEVLAWPVTVDLDTARRAFGLGRGKAYELARAGTFPVPLLKIGQRYRVVTADVCAALGLTSQREAASSVTEPAA